MNFDKIAVLAPVYNEADHLAAFLERLKHQGYPILVVDDGSSDRSAQIARAKNVDLIVFSGNQGKGNALRAGFRQLLAKGMEWIIIMDSDGQHLAEEIPIFIAKAREGGYGIINGNRLWRPLGMPGLRLFVNHLMSGIVSLLAG